MAQKRSLETREKIKKAAADLFNQAGYDETSVDGICREAGVSKGAFYHHYPSKQTVFLALLEDWLGSLNSGLEALRGLQVDPARALVRMTEIIPSILESAEGRVPIFLEFWARSCREPQLWVEATAPLEKYREYFKSILKEGTTSGKLPEVDPETASSVILAFALGILLQGILNPKGEDWGRVGKEGMQAIMEGMTRRSK